MVQVSRRRLFGLGVALVAAPAIVRVAAHLMPVSTRAAGSHYAAYEWNEIRVRLFWDFDPPTREQMFRAMVRMIEDIRHYS